MHCKSIEINQFINTYLSQHLKGNALAYITKLFLNAPCQSKKGHSLDEAYSMSLKYTAKILGRSRETIRRLQEELHALGIITIDNQSWEAYHDAQKRRKKTGLIQDVRFSIQFKNMVKRFLSKDKQIEWTFTKPESFLEKCQKHITKAKEAKDRFIKKLLKEEKVQVKEPPQKLVEDIKILLKVAQTTNQMDGVMLNLTKRLVEDGYAQDHHEAELLIQSIHST